MSGKFKNTAKENKKEFIKFLILGLIFVFMGFLTIKLWPFIISLKDEEGREALKDFIISRGSLGVLTFLGIQVLQIIVAVIPGEPIEVLAGLIYGTWGGYLICTVGVLIGTIIIYYTVKLLGMSFIELLIDKEKLEKYKFLHDAKKLEAITFTLFFIPGTPKDLLTYFMPLTKIKPWVLFTIVTVARAPSIISSTFAGASIGAGKLVQTIVIFVVIGAIGILGIMFNDKIIKAFNSKKENIKSKIKERTGHDK